MLLTGTLQSTQYAMHAISADSAYAQASLGSATRNSCRMHVGRELRRRLTAEVCVADPAGDVEDKPGEDQHSHTQPYPPGCRRTHTHSQHLKYTQTHAHSDIHFQQPAGTDTNMLVLP